MHGWCCSEEGTTKLPIKQTNLRLIPTHPLEPSAHKKAFLCLMGAGAHYLPLPLATPIAPQVP